MAVVKKAWWDTPEHNLTEVVFQGISSDSARNAALLSGEMDVFYPVASQDVLRLEATYGVCALIGPELRTIFLGLAQDRDELLQSSVKGASPFRDQRGWLAMYQSIDMDAIVDRIMRGKAATAAMVAPGCIGLSGGRGASFV